MPADTIGGEISQLMRRGPSRGPQMGQPFDRARAIAAALNMARRGALGRKGMKRIGKRGKRRGMRG